MDPSTLGSTRRRATVAMREPETLRVSRRTSRERNPPVPITRRDEELSEPTLRFSVTPPSVAREEVALGWRECNP